MLRYIVFAFILACGGSSACGSRSAHAPDPSPTPESNPDPTSPIQAVHEWGLVSVGALGVELAAGPGQRVLRADMLTVDKPVLYVHASRPTPLHLSVAPGEGMSVAEHFPPSRTSTLTWDVEVTPGECTAPRDYTRSCDSTDGYCETHELALYETSDAACLAQGEQHVPLLFYRLHADAPPAMPLVVERTDASGAHLRNTGLEAGASVWRISWDGAVVHATHALAPQRGEAFVVQRSLQGGPGEVRAAMRRDLEDLGLTRHEASAFMRAWDSALFGEVGSIDGDIPAADGIPSDSPVDVLTADETILDRRGGQGAPRVTEALLYWLPSANIDAMAALTFRPQPQEVRRAILVRVDLR